MSLPAFATRNKTITTVSVLVLLAWGIMSYLTMPRREDPEFVIRTCQVLSKWPGAPTEKMEELVTAPLEDEINTLDGIRWVRSETRVGYSAIYVELDRPTPGTRVDQMWDMVRARVSRVAMPDPSVHPTVIDDFGDSNIMLLAVHQVPLAGESKIREDQRYSMRDLDIFSQRIQDDLKIVNGVAMVTRSGVQNEAIYIEGSLGRLSQLSITTDELQQLLSSRNVIASGGSVEARAGRVSVEPSGDFDALREIDSLVVGEVGVEGSRAPVYLSDLGLKVIRSYQDPPDIITHYTDPKDTGPCVLIGFTMKNGANIEVVCAAARNVIHNLRDVSKTLPIDLAVDFVSDQSVSVDRRIGQFVGNVIGAILIVVLVVFLMVGFRSAFVMAANIPIVIIGSLAIVTLFGVQLEQISIAAMIIALGMLVDNAVQVTDQTRRMLSEGHSRAQAARIGADQLSFPILIATGTTIAAFYPMLLGLKGGTREFIYSLPVTITVTLGLSYVIAMTFCVLLAQWFVRAPKDPEASLSPVVGLIKWITGRKKRGGAETAPTDTPKKKGLAILLYEGVSMVSLRLKWIVVIGSFAVLVAVMMLPVGSQFFPADLRDQFAVEVWLAESANIYQTEEATKRVEAMIRKLSPYTDDEGQPGERLMCMASVIGGGAPRWYLGRNPEAQKPNYAEIVVRTTDVHVTDALVQEIRTAAAEGDPARGIEPIDGVRVIPRELILGTPVDAPIGIRLFAPRLGTQFADVGIIREHAETLKKMLRKMPGTWDIYDSWGGSGLQLFVNVDEDKANLAGVTNLGLARSLNAYLSGHYLTTFREGDHKVPVYLRLPADERGSTDILREAYVEGLHGKVPLDAVATTKMRYEPAKIERRFLQRVIEVRARIEDGVRSNDVVNALMAKDEFKEWAANLPPGYWWEVGGELFESKLGREDLMVSLLISVLAIILLLVIQYNGMMKPIIILSTLPLALIGAFGGLYITGYPLGFMGQLGLLSLFGVVVNTAIIYLEFADRLIEEKAAASDGSGPIMGLTKAEFRECLIKAGEVRMLPIAMTTLTTIGGLFPLAIAGGPLWAGMSWLMIFGLMVATVLTLFIVPALYAIFVETFRIRPLPKPAEAE